ncbi:MAG: hypothetical protein RL033_6695 [Pseudomonadota bacterium]|jgi:hypothetical protein
MTFAGHLDPPGDGTELTLELARRSHEPIAADKARNLLALRQRLGLPGLPSNGAAAPVLQPVAATARARALRLAPWQQLVAVGTVTGAIGFFLGLGVSERASNTAASNTPPAELQQALATLPAPAALAVTPPQPTMAESALAESALAKSALAESAEPSAAPSVNAALRARAPKTRRTAARSASTERSDPDFLEAVRLLSRARRTLDRQEPALALSLLDELDERFPRQLLDEERAATRVFALCANGDREAALTLARSWFSQRPRSIYTRRLEQSCASEALR